MDSDLEKIYKAGLQFLVPLTPAETYALIVKEAIKLVKAEHGSILLMRDGELQRVYATDPFFYNIVPRKRGINYTVFKTRKAQTLSSSDTKHIHPEIKEVNVNSDILVPLSYKNKSIGVLSLMSSKHNYFKKRDLNILRLFSPLASLAIRKTELYDETKKALESRDLFISMAAHELRTPLTSIHGYIQLLRHKMTGLDTPEARWVEHLFGESVRMTNLVNELLEINRIKSGDLQYNLKECNLREIIQRAIANFKLTHPERVIELEDTQINGRLPAVIGDYDKILQVVTNLVDNAIKFSPFDSKITIVLQSSKNQLYFAVKDMGRGIEKKDRIKIFESFYQGQDSGVEGMGLGLFIVKEVINKHHGTIKVLSKRNKGTTIEVKLPGVKHE